MNQWQGWLYVAAVLIPLGAFVVQILGIRRTRHANALIATVAIAISLLLSMVGLGSYWVESGGMAVHHVEVGAATPGVEEEGHPGTGGGKVAWTGSWDWVSLGGGLSPDRGPLRIPIGIFIDNLAAIMFVMVTFIATLIHVYSMEYMGGDPRLPRYFAYLSLFCFSMLGLVASSNAFMVFVFWELVGLCSYLLIGFWYEDRSNADAANKAFLVNRVGDVGMLVGLGLLWTQLGTLDIAEINSGLASVEARQGDDLGRIAAGEPAEEHVVVLGAGVRAIPHWVLVLAGLGIFAGCVGKSAQFPLHVWLPDAMAGPTPVSALIHAATMVAAGVYLVGRFFPLFTDEVLLIIAYAGGITLFIAATIALVQVDYKKVLAYSTVSQLGFMMLALGVGGWAAGLFHLLTHAFFKALLFLGAGSVHHAVHTYDLRPLGGLRRKMPITSTTMLLATLAISGVPLFSGFYSKDAILASAIRFVVDRPGHVALLILPAIGAAMTAFYMFRMWFLLFSGRSRGWSASGLVAEHGHEDDPVTRAHEGGPRITWPLRILAVPTVMIGWPLTILPLTIVGLPFHPILEDWLAYGAPLSARSIGSAHLWAAATSILVLVVGIGLAFLAYHPSKTIRRIDPARMAGQLGGLYGLFVNKWYFDEVYQALFVRPTLAIARLASRFDRTVIDGVVEGSARATVALSLLDRRVDQSVVDRVVTLVARLTFALGDAGRRLQTGRVRGYLMVLSLAFIVLSVGVFVWVIR
ncbi:NADH-quinone oxidoreductase subunit L [Tautonia plasticadhaerens]|uniref:NADH-quinone oxidoreductase subunit L n=1 Tax=Tautonia plasticadhaerens TaxID=2527974 RepID=A0A518GY54_9BACT|nr:NADH-quinone oxidoreductase subunit L [Tautonia plasticadhaerens]QDV33528.1 NADH-quinone oxidoreductase subunit L [Tautonia plasticadhaerens]